MILFYAIASPQADNTSLNEHSRKQEFLVVSITAMIFTEMKEF